uniref:Uncharacterized protein n=1 Tax=Oryza brachyantha TaxID=4533 RepID=J3LDF8_ORYBR
MIIFSMIKDGLRWSSGMVDTTKRSSPKSTFRTKIYPNFLAIAYHPTRTVREESHVIIFGVVNKVICKSNIAMADVGMLIYDRPYFKAVRGDASIVSDGFKLSNP